MRLSFATYSFGAVAMSLSLIAWTPVDTAAQTLWWSGGAHMAYGHGVPSVTSTEIGGQLNLQPSSAALLTFGLAKIVSTDSPPSTSVTGATWFVVARFTPWQRVWHLGGGWIRADRRLFRERAPFSDFTVDSDKFGPLFTTGLRLPVGRIRPFGEVRYAMLFGANNAWSFAAGIDIWAFETPMPKGVRLPPR